jgi:hypothetical protein
VETENNPATNARRSSGGLDVGSTCGRGRKPRQHGSQHDNRYFFKAMQHDYLCFRWEL